MAYKVSKAEVWATDIPNRPGTLSGLLEPLSDAGAQLEFMIARKADGNTSRVFVSPIKGSKQKKAAQSVGLTPAAGLHGLRVEGPDKPGLGSKLTRAIADEGVNLRGASAAAVGRNAIFYLAVESEQDLKKAMRAAKSAVSARRK